MAQTAATGEHSLNIQGIRTYHCTRGAGKPLLFLHPGIGIDLAAPALDLLSERVALHVPSHPGYGKSELPKWMSTVDDLAYFYLDYLDALDLRDVILVGASLGGWIAAEIAVKSTERISHLVLAGAGGIKISDREHRDFVDVFNVSHAELEALTYHNQKFASGALTSQSEQALATMFRNRESTGLFAWSPYMHNPALRRRLHRIKVPTLLLWGANDRIVSPDYGRAYASDIPGATFATIADSGHYPHIEQPAAFAQQIFAFVDSAKRLKKEV